VSLSDVAVAVAGARQRTAVDVLAIGDSALRAAAPQARIASDALALADTATRAPLARPQTASDALTVTDTVTRVQALVVTATDSLFVADIIPTAEVKSAGDELFTIDSAPMGVSQLSIGGPVALGNNSPALVTSQTVSMTTTAAVAVGDVIIVTVGSTTASRVCNTVTDSAGNSYTKRGSSLSSTVNAYGFTAMCNTALPSGSTITATFASSLSSIMGIEAFKVSGLQNAMDVAPTTTTATGTAWGIAVAPVSANTLVVGASVLNDTRTNAPNGVSTEVADFAGSGGNKYAHTAVYSVRSSAGSVTPGGTWNGSAAHADISMALPQQQQAAVADSWSVSDSAGGVVTQPPAPTISLSPTSLTFNVNI
jgi:hypothetical protein